MSNTKLVSNFLLKVEPELAAQIEQSRRRNGERSAVAALRELIKRGLAAERAA
jgi:hypothetical protein